MTNTTIQKILLTFSFVPFKEFLSLKKIARWKVKNMAYHAIWASEKSKE
jgi:hypothetical protein